MRAWLMAALAVAAPAPTRVFDAAWRIVARRYWDPALHGVDWPALRVRYRAQAAAARDPRALYAVIGALLDTLGDSHVYAVPPAAVRAARRRAAPGFGFVADPDGGGWRVVSVAPGSAAARAGVRPGWTLVSIDGDPVDPDRDPAAGTTARIAFRDAAGRPRPLDLAAAPMPPVPGVTATRLPGGVLLIAVRGFEHREDHDVAAALRARPAPRAVILDLRDNDGGDEGIAARTAGLFFAHGRPLLIRIDRSGSHVVPVQGARPDRYAGPLAVLVGPGSASAAEALAALFADSGRAATVGERTAGALTGAEIVSLPDGGRLSVAVDDVRTPGGTRIERRGFLPAHIVAPGAADPASGRDPALAEAARLLGTAS